MFIKKLDNLVNSPNIENFISRHQNKNVTSPIIPVIGRNRVEDYAKSKEKIEVQIQNTSNVGFFYKRLIKYNKQKKKNMRL